MRVALALVAFATSASASILTSRAGFPNCAIPCLTNADFGGCVPTDNHCLCTNNAFVSSTTTCIQKSCTGTDLTNAEAAAQELCRSVGVTLTASSTTPTATQPSTKSAGSVTSSSSTTTASATPSHAGARSNGVNVFAGAAAFGLVAAAVL